MARGDGIDRTNARNMRLTETKIGNTQQHNEREKDSYVNQDIVPERTSLNVHFKAPSAGYQEMFSQMEADGVISTRGIKADAFRYGELVFDVNSAYFYNHDDPRLLDAEQRMARLQRGRSFRQGTVKLR